MCRNIKVRVLKNKYLRDTLYIMLPKDRIKYKYFVNYINS